MSRKITVATCCYENDIDFILKHKNVGNLFDTFSYPFYEKLLIINVNKKDEWMKECAEQCVKEGIIDNFYFTADYKSSVMKCFDIENFDYIAKLKLLDEENNSPIEILKRAYRFYFPHRAHKMFGLFKIKYDCTGYALGILSAIYFAKGDYLLYFTEDCIMADQNQWIDEGIELMDENSQYFAARPYNHNLDDNWYKNWELDRNYYIRSIFTDQMFLSSVKRLREVDYNAKDTGIYPVYGGAGFEARIYNYMSSQNLRMIIHRNAKYEHEYAGYNKIF